MQENDKPSVIDNLIWQNFSVEQNYNIDKEVLSYDQVEFLVYNLPAMNSIMQGILNYVFASEIQLKNSKGDVLSDSETQKILSSKNINGVDFRSLFRDVTRELFEHGAIGIRKIDNHFITLKKNSYDIILKESDEHKFVYLPKIYLIRREKAINRKIRVFNQEETIQDRRFEIDEQGRVISTTKNWLALDDTEFINLTLDNSIVGLSPVEFDKTRTHLTLLLLDYFIHDFKRKGIGTLMFKYNRSTMAQLSKEIATTSGKIFDTSSTNQEFNEKREKSEIQELVNQLATVRFNDSVIYPDAFDEATQLKRDSKPSDYLETLQVWITRFICQIYGVSPQVFHLVESSGNTGKEEIIKTFILHWVIPTRNMLADKFTRILNLVGYDYTIQFKNEEESDYYEYADDLDVLAVYEKLIELGLEDKAEEYLNNNFVR